MEKLLIYIKHNLKFLWRVIDWGNDILFRALYMKRMRAVIPGVFREFTIEPFIFRQLLISDAGKLHSLINKQNASELEYFRPHEFDLKAIESQFSNRAFLMMGVFNEDDLIGYFFLRFFCNRTCFVGRLIDTEYRGRGIGNVMNKIMYETAWRMSFRCLSTISRNNKLVMHAHERNSKMKVLKELRNDFLLVEFVNKND
jgi:RimJ/RimL family protein N-acetyltransferase